MSKMRARSRLLLVQHQNKHRLPSQTTEVVNEDNVEPQD